MTEDDDIDGLAAEYVLGSLDAEERKDVAARRMTNVALDHAIKAWEMRLDPLSDGVPGINPPPDVFPRIAERLWAREAIKARKPVFSRQRALAAGACALAACLALAVVWLRHLPGVPTTLVAQLKPSALWVSLEPGTNVWTPFGFDVSVDLRASTIVVSPVAAGVSESRDYQLWLIPRDGGPLISLGVIALPKTTISAWLATYPPDDLPNTTLAVSLEPEGGSRTGIPSGPPVFVGTLSPVTPKS
jgi:anti-sigma-K factor RskA